ncbi:MAG: hypothetical protein KatS3mg102_0983 [Planctomycetota bacterium]|nr:MAG: hypothetical protein KatS3mg102_0983 [Planctomycetota bacterium]
MAKLSQRVKHQRLKRAAALVARGEELPRALRKYRFSTRVHNRCELCGRPRAYYRRFKICRCCFRDLALQGMIPGCKKASW